MISHHTHRIAFVLSTLLLSNGCAIYPHSTYTTPVVMVPGQWKSSTTSDAKIASRHTWWQNFNDPLLNELVDRALRTNNDLAAAAIKVRRAQLQAGLIDTNLTPAVEISSATAFDRDLKNRTGSQSYRTTTTVSYELDLWGRLARLRDAGRWEAEATEVDLQNTALSLIGTVAAAYWQVAYLNQRVTLSEAGITYAEKSLQIVTTQYRAGAVSALDAAQARQNLATRRADLSRLVQQRVEARNALALLFNGPPENSVAEIHCLPEGPLPTVAPGIPADLLGQRPDLRAAELRLRKALAQTDAVRASLYPAFTLTGSLGTVSTSLADVLRDPITSLGIGLVLPFVQWNTTKLTIKVSETEYQEAVIGFRQTLYQALSDVENALSNNNQLDTEKVQLHEALAASSLAEKLAETRYRAGAVGLKSWLDAQEERRNAEASLAENSLNRLNNRMALYMALGGNMRTSGQP